MVVLKKPDLNFVKRAAFTLTKNIIDLYDTENYVYMMEQNLNFYDVITRDKDLTDFITKGAKHSGLSARLIDKLVREDSIEEFLNTRQTNLTPVYASEMGRVWVKQQIGDLMRRLFESVENEGN